MVTTGGITILYCVLGVIAVIAVYRKERRNGEK